RAIFAMLPGFNPLNLSLHDAFQHLQGHIAHFSVKGYISVNAGQFLDLTLHANRLFNVRPPGLLYTTSQVDHDTTRITHISLLLPEVSWNYGSNCFITLVVTSWMRPSALLRQVWSSFESCSFPPVYRIISRRRRSSCCRKSI